MLTADSLQTETLRWKWTVKHIRKHVIQNMKQRKSKESKQPSLMEEQFAEAVID